MTTTDLLNLPLSALDDAVQTITAHDAWRLSREFDAIMERAAQVRAYVDARRISHQSHDVAVKDANALRTKIRRVLGYTQPRDDHAF